MSTAIAVHNNIIDTQYNQSKKLRNEEKYTQSKFKANSQIQSQYKHAVLIEISDSTHP